MQQALDALVHVWNTTPDDDVVVDNAIATLRKTLAEPVVEPVLHIAKALRVHGMSLIKTTDGYDIMRLDDIKAQSKSPQPSPAKVPLLTDEEILVIMRDGNDCNYCNYNDEGEHIDFAREIERIIRKKVGIK
jgi:predicted Zn-ribbon and HTH transcriptional regulator